MAALPAFFVLLTGFMQAQRHELVARWPHEARAGYNRVFASQRACERARQTIMADHARRVADIRRRNAQDAAAGVPRVIYGEPAVPMAVCIPL